MPWFYEPVLVAGALLIAGLRNRRKRDEGEETERGAEEHAVTAPDAAEPGI
jgi:hypothetical protein